jgi:hypothetical protein
LWRPVSPSSSIKAFGGFSCTRQEHTLHVRSHLHTVSRSELVNACPWKSLFWKISESRHSSTRSSLHSAITPGTEGEETRDMNRKIWGRSYIGKETWTQKLHFLLSFYCLLLFCIFHIYRNCLFRGYTAAILTMIMRLTCE